MLISQSKEFPPRPCGDSVNSSSSRHSKSATSRSQPRRGSQSTTSRRGDYLEVEEQEENEIEEDNGDKINAAASISRDWAPQDFPQSNTLSDEFGDMSISCATTHTIDARSLGPDTGYTNAYYTPNAYHEGKGKGKGKQIQPVLAQKTQVPWGDRRHVASTPGDSEKLDKSYKVRNHDYKDFFRIGRVFQTLWTESWSSNTGHNETFVSEVIFKEKVHSKIRRFVVVKKGDKFCTCIPVTSYGGQGYRKAGIDLTKHSFVYSNRNPRQIPGIQLQPLKIDLAKNAEKLNDHSLVNYGKIYTVENNVKVKDVGKLVAQSIKVLRRTWQEIILESDDDDDDTIDDFTPAKEPKVWPARVGDTVSGGGYDPNNSQQAQYSQNVYHPQVSNLRNTYEGEVNSPQNWGTNSTSGSSHLMTTNIPYSVTSGPRPNYFPASTENHASGGAYPQVGYTGNYSATNHWQGAQNGFPQEPQYAWGNQGHAEYQHPTNQFSGESSGIPRSHHNDTAYPSAESTGEEYNQEKYEDIDLVNTNQMQKESQYQQASKSSKSPNERRRRK